MRFVFLASPTSIHTQRWVDGLRARGHEVVVVPNNEGGARGVRKVARWLRYTLRLRRLAGRPHTLLVVHWIPAGLRALALLGLHPRVGIAWGSDIFMMSPPVSGGVGLRARQQSMFLRGCDLVLGTSQALADAAVAAGAPPTRTRCLRFGVDIARFCPGPEPVGLRARLGLDGVRVVLSNRAITSLYRQTAVVEALAKLPADVVVVMTRQRADPTEVEQVEALAVRLGLLERVRIVSEIADGDMGDLYRLADVVISVPASDGGASTIVEALATGRQIVASDIPSNREWLAVLDPDALVPVGDSGATAQALLRALARSRAERDALGARARAMVEAHGDAQDALAEMERIHAGLVVRHGMVEAQ